MLFTAYLNRRSCKTLLESRPLHVVADTLEEAQEKWAIKVREDLKSHGCGSIPVPDRVKVGWKGEGNMTSFSLTAKQQRR